MWQEIIILIHSWYPAKCCSDTDCKPVPCDEIFMQNDGTALFHNLLFAKENISNSLDGMCHACISAGGYPLCLFIQSLS